MKRIKQKLLVGCMIAFMSFGVNGSEMIHHTIEVQAATVVASGTCGKKMTWQLDGEGTLTISGSGEMENFAIPEGDNEGAPWLEYSEQIKNVKIKKGITYVGANAFYGCSNLETIIIPEGVTDIGGEVGEECDNLKKVQFPGTIKVSPYEDYDYMAQGIIVHKDYVAVDGVLFNKSKTKLLRYSSQKTDKEYSVPESVKKIADSAFDYNNHLESLILPKGLKQFSSATLTECYNIKKLTIPASLKKLNMEYTIDTLEEIKVVKGNGKKRYSSKDGVLFNAKKTKLITYPAAKKDTEYKIPKSVKKIAGSAFLQCHNLEYVEIPNGLEKMVSFHGCVSLEMIKIPEGLENAGSYEECYALKSVVIPSSVKEMSKYTFNLCRNHLTIYGEKDSYAQKYAKKYGYKFIVLEGDTKRISVCRRAVVTGVENGKTYKGSVKLSVFGEGIQSVKLNGKKIKNGKTVKKKGKYTLVITNSYGLKEKVKFRIK